MGKKSFSNSESFQGNTSFACLVTVPTWLHPEALLVLLDLGQDEVELLVLLPVLARVQRARLDQVVLQLPLLAGPELATAALAVHPLGFQAENKKRDSFGVNVNRFSRLRVSHEHSRTHFSRQ